MFPNIRAEMARNKIILIDISVVLGKSIGTVSRMLNGEAPISLDEAKAIKTIIKSDLPLEELFKTETEATK
jgi:hypothetical protein